MADEMDDEEVEEMELEGDDEFPEDDDSLLDEGAEEPLAGDDEAVLESDEEDEEDSATAAASPRRPSAESEEDEEDDEEDGEDVEASLDVILKERLVVEEEEQEDDDEEEGHDHDDRGDSNRKVEPRRPDEFVCQSCFLVKHPSQLADKKQQLCFDCV